MEEDKREKEVGWGCKKLKGQKEEIKRRRKHEEM